MPLRHKINVNSLLSGWYMVCLLLPTHFPYPISHFLVSTQMWHQNMKSKSIGSSPILLIFSPEVQALHLVTHDEHLYSTLYFLLI